MPYTYQFFREEDVVKKYIAVNVFDIIKMYYVNAKGHTIKEEILTKDETQAAFGRRLYIEMIKLQGKAFNQVLVWSKS